MLDGTLHPDFSDVVAVLLRQMPRRGAAPAGAALCVYHRGQPVVDVWGGVRDAAGNPWRGDTTAPCFSTTKGVISTLVHILVDQGRASYDDPVARYWPAFGCRGKERITIRQALTHEAGLYRITEIISTPAEMLNWDHMKARLADATPVHVPGLGSGYHALTYGWLIGGLIEGITGAPLTQVLRDELVAPLALDGAFIGMPAAELHRRAELIHGLSRPARPKPEWRVSLRSLAARGLATIGVELDEFSAALDPFTQPFDWNAPETVQAVIPAANGQFTARSLARIYAMLAGAGSLDGVRLLSEARVRELAAVHGRGRDRVLFIPMQWRLGYHRAFVLGMKAPHAFGHYGYGGSGAFCDPSRELAVAFTLNSGSGTPMGNSQLPRIARAALRAVDRIDR
jgi:CubicO group peptidase (beta-lactamase class C family)